MRRALSYLSKMPPVNSESIIHQIRERIDYPTLFAEFLQMRGHGSERSAFCIFHENTESPAMSVNLRDGLFFCHNPECGARGDFLDFYRRVRDLTFPEAVEELARRLGIEIERDASRGDVAVIDEAIVTSAHERLMATPSLLEFLSTRRGLSTEAIRRWQLGHDGQRYFIPIRDEVGRCVNIRRYAPTERRSHFKMISWREGYGGARLWPFDSLERAAVGQEPILLLEGEMDCLLALQLGFCAMTATGGAGTWRDVWNPLFAGKDVLVCYDVDQAGRLGALQVAHHLSPVARSIKVVTLPITEPENADFTDYIVGHGHSADDFRALVEITPAFALTPAQSDALSEAREQREPVNLHLSNASRAEFYNQPIRVPVMVSGKTTAPYLVPKTVRMTCGMPGLRMCERCPVAQRAGNLTHSLEYDSNEVLQFTEVNEQTRERQLKQKVGVPGKCGYVETEVVESLNVEAVQLIPEIDRSSDEEAQYVTRLAYYIGHGLQANRNYLMTGVTVPDPRKQLATHLIHTAIPSQSNIDAFRLSEEVVERLRVFQPTRAGVDGLWEHLDTMYDDLENHTRIYQRRDLMLAVDLTFHSLLTFSFQGDKLARGWVEALVIGDSRTGKTTIVQRLVDYYGAGEFSSGENTSYAGLVGGLHQIGNSWALQWGRVPLNDRRLLVIDEAGNMPQEQIARMSSMRSSGIAEVVKIHTERTNARTRQIWISNPRAPRPLSSYSQGVLAVKELVGAPEDIARFDLVVTAASGDVALAVVNAERQRAEPSTFTSDLCHQRVMWAWSRGSDAVDWARGATAHLLRRATQQGERYRYATEIPLVEPNEQRIKLARLAVAAAVLFFSASDDGESVVVTRDHVEFAAQYLERLYAKPSLSFEEYARAKHAAHELSDPDAVGSIVRGTGDAVRQFMEQEQFTQRDLQEILAIDDRDGLRRAITALKTAGFIRRQGSSFYYKTAAGIAWLRRELSDPNAGSMNAGALASDMLPDVPDF